MREISVIKGRILQYLESKGITKYTFYKVTGVANGILSQPNGISEDTLRRFLENYPDVSGDWLLRGEGSMLRHTGHTSDSYLFYRPENASTERVSDVGASYNGIPSSGAFGIPVADLDAAADAEPAASRTGEVVFLPEFAAEEGLFLCFRTGGEAMYPTLQEGGYMICRLLSQEEWKTIDEESICVLVTKERKYFVRRLKVRNDRDGAFTASADNPDRHNYPVLRFEAEEVDRIWHVEWYMTPILTNPNDRKVRQLEEEVSDLKHRMNRLLPNRK